MPDGGIPTRKPSTSTLDWGARVRQAWGDAWHEKDISYDFSNGRQFKDSAPNGGPYTLLYGGLVQEEIDPSLMRYPAILLEDRGRVLCER